MKTHTPFFILVLVIIGPAALWADCKGGMFGASSKGTMLSSVDLTMSPTYSGASTSGTSGCKNWEFVQKSQPSPVDVFVANNQKWLLEQMAQAKGEHVQTLATLVGCPVHEQPRFIQMVQQNYAKWQTFHSPYELSQAIVNQVQQHPLLQHTCVKEVL